MSTWKDHCIILCLLLFVKRLANRVPVDRAAQIGGLLYFRAAAIKPCHFRKRVLDRAKHPFKLFSRQRSHPTIWVNAGMEQDILQHAVAETISIIAPMPKLSPKACPVRSAS